MHLRRFPLAGILLLAGALAAQQLPTNYSSLPRGAGVYRGHHVTYRVLDGQALVQGDILLGPVESLEPFKDDARDAIVISAERYRWPNSTVVYELDPNLPSKDRITNAIAEWESKTPIRFKLRDNESDYVRIVRASSGCSSNVGRIGGRQVVNLSDGCSTGNTVHELGHSIGLFHTQSRIDRNRNIRVLFENLDKAYWDQYEQLFTTAQDVGPYDYASIMHYGVRGFERNTRNGMETTPRGIPIGARTTLSSGDVLAVRKVYGETLSEVTIASHPAGIKLIVDGEEITAPKSFPWKPGERHTVSAADRAPGPNVNQEYRFAKWSDNGAQEHMLTVGEGDYLFIANYAQFVRVRTAANPESAGTVEISPPSPDGFYPFGSVLSIRAVPSGDLKFLDWTPGVGGATYLAVNSQGGGAQTTELCVRNDDAFYIARFTANPITTVTSNPPGMLVVVDGLSAYTPRNFAWSAGSSHSIAIAETQQINNATASAAFVEWSNGEPRAHDYIALPEGGTLTAAVKRRFQVLSDVDSLVTVGSTFARASQLRLSPQPTGGLYDEGTEIEASAEGTASVPFTNFYSDLSSSTNPQKLTVRDQSMVGANFLSPALFNSRGLVNVASQLPTPASPGAAMTLYSPEVGPDEEIELKPEADGRYPLLSNGVRVTFGDTPAELLRHSKNSITFLVPWDIPAKPTVSVTLFRPTIRFTNTLPAEPAAPGVDSLSSKGPVFRGSELTLRVTGIGRFTQQQSNAPPPAGPLTPIEKLEVELEEVPVEVIEVTAADKPGVYNVRVRVSDAIPLGDAIPVFVISGGTRSQFGVTVSVR